MQSFLQILTGVSFIPALCGEAKTVAELVFSSTVAFTHARAHL